MTVSTADQQDDGSFLVLSRAAAEWSCGGLPAFVLLVGGLAAVFGPTPWSIVAGVLALLAGLAFVVPGRLRIDSQGITLRWLWTERTVPFEEIEAVSLRISRIVSARSAPS